MAQNRNIDTLSEAMHTLNAEGFTKQFISIADGIQDTNSKRIYKQDEIEVVEQFRFEGMSNPADSTLLLSLKSKDGAKGTIVVNYGADHFQNIKNIIKL